jgi:hypothetical protein
MWRGQITTSVLILFQSNFPSHEIKSSLLILIFGQNLDFRLDFISGEILAPHMWGGQITTSVLISVLILFLGKF